jgi:nucleoside-diphosphate-sugar epimerase
VETLLDKIKRLLPGTLLEVHGNTPGDQPGIFADARKMKSILGTSISTPLEQGLEKFLKWIRNHQKFSR